MGGQVFFRTITLSTGVGRVEPMPRAAGQEAFWAGLPIWANPWTGEPARQWTSGWKAGLADLRSQCDEECMPAADGSGAWQALVRRHRPNGRRKAEHHRA